MKKLLILAYDFPPYVSVGALRPYAWYKYLKEYGIYPIVVTRQWGNAYGDERDYIAPGESSETIVEETEYGTLIRTPYKPNVANRLMLKYGKSRYALLRKAISAYYELAQYIWNIGPKSCVYRGAKQYLKTHKADAIIATSEPFVLFKYASVLSEQFNIPWIADYRDTWVQSYNRNKHYIQKCVNQIFEKKYLTDVSASTTVSEYIKLQIQQVYNRNIKIIANGYDDDVISGISHLQQNNPTYTISFAGTLYPWHPIKSFFNCMEKFIKQNNINELNIDFYGTNKEKYITDIVDKDYAVLHSYIHVYPKMAHEKLLKKIASSHILLLFNDYSAMGTKIYDYIGLKRKVLLCYSNDKNANELKNAYYPIPEIKRLSTHLQADLLKDTNAGIVVENEEELIKVLTELYDEYTHNGCIACNSHDIEKYSRKEQTGKLAEIINDIIHEC